MSAFATTLRTLSGSRCRSLCPRSHQPRTQAVRAFHGSSSVHASRMHTARKHGQKMPPHLHGRPFSTSSSKDASWSAFWANELKVAAALLACGGAAVWVYNEYSAKTNKTWDAVDSVTKANEAIMVNDNVAALLHLRKAMGETNSTHAQARIAANMGFCFERMNHRDLATKQFNLARRKMEDSSIRNQDKSAAAKRESAIVFDRCAQALHDNGNFVAAQMTYVKALAVLTTADEFMDALSRIDTIKDDPDAQENGVVQFAGLIAGVCNNIAMGYLEDEQYASALEVLLRSEALLVHVVPKDDPVQSNLPAIQQAINDLIEAFKVREVGPDDQQ